MGDVGDTFRALKAHKKALKDKHGVLCPGCQKRFPKAHPKILLPGQRCFCGHRDPRPREPWLTETAPISQEAWDSLSNTGKVGPDKPTTTREA